MAENISKSNSRMCTKIVCSNQEGLLSSNFIFNVMLSEKIKEPSHSRLYELWNLQRLVFIQSGSDVTELCLADAKTRQTLFSFTHWKSLGRVGVISAD